MTEWTRDRVQALLEGIERIVLYPYASRDHLIHDCELGRIAMGDLADLCRALRAVAAERDAALARAEKAEARSEALWNALDRLRPVPERLLRGVPVRDLSEALGEADAALAQEPSE